MFKFYLNDFLWIIMMFLVNLQNLKVNAMIIYLSCLFLSKYTTKWSIDWQFVWVDKVDLKLKYHVAPIAQ